MLHAEDRWARKVSGTKCASLTRWLLYKGADHFVFSTVDAGDFLSEFWGIGQLQRFEPLLIIVWLEWGASLKCFFGSELSSHDTAGNWLKFSRRRARWLVEGIPEWDAKAFVSLAEFFPEICSDEEVCLEKWIMEDRRKLWGASVVTWCLRTYIGLRPYMVKVYIKERINDQITICAGGEVTGNTTCLGVPQRKTLLT